VVAVIPLPDSSGVAVDVVSYSGDIWQGLSD
jgi:hypothetical protein